MPDQGGGGPPDSDDPDDEDPDKESQPAGDIVINPLDTFWWDENPNDPVNEDE
ncbi:MAG: hypothetical protein Q8P83_03590 [bacterium]|nr:hypothetical protein [bacterium]